MKNKTPRTLKKKKKKNTFARFSRSGFSRLLLYLKMIARYIQACVRVRSSIVRGGLRSSSVYTRVKAFLLSSQLERVHVQYARCGESVVVSINDKNVSNNTTPFLYYSHQSFGINIKFAKKNSRRRATGEVGSKLHRQPAA